MRIQGSIASSKDVDSYRFTISDPGLEKINNSLIHQGNYYFTVVPGYCNSTFVAETCSPTQLSPSIIVNNQYTSEIDTDTLCPAIIVYLDPITDPYVDVVVSAGNTAFLGSYGLIVKCSIYLTTFD